MGYLCELDGYEVCLLTYCAYVVYVCVGTYVYVCIILCVCIVCENAVHEFTYVKCVRCIFMVYVCGMDMYFLF